MKDVVVFFNFPRGSNTSYNIFFLLIIIGASGSRVLIFTLGVFFFTLSGQKSGPEEVFNMEYIQQGISFFLLTSLFG